VAVEVEQVEGEIGEAPESPPASASVSASRWVTPRWIRHGDLAVEQGAAGRGRRLLRP
jgi:hypothetical protein